MKPEFCNAKLLVKLDVPSRDIFECDINSTKGTQKELTKQCPCNGDTNLCNQAISQNELVKAKIGGAINPELKINPNSF